MLGFEYRPLTEAESGGPDTEGEEGETTGKKKKKKVTQAALNQAAVKTILQESARGPFTALAAPMPTEKNPTRTLLEKRLADYTARNTFDYFIHKDLGGFLRRELDFYLKNEVLHLDDLEKAGQDTWDSARQKMLALRAIAHRITRFLAQIEDFQRKLWLKKKFVVGCDYVLTLDRIPVSLYPEIAACEAQREEWVRLFGIEEIKGYSVPLTVAFLKGNQGLVVDTSHFTTAFRSVVTTLSTQTDQLSVAVKADSRNGLMLLQPTIHGKVSTIFTDPPYNTGEDGFPYKDAYQHSSWLSMIADRFSAARMTMSKTGLLFATIDYVEVSRFRVLLDQIFGESGFVADIAWEKRYTRSNNAKRFYSLKDTVLTYRRSEDRAEIKERRTDKSKENYTNPDNDERGPWISSSYVNPATRSERENLCYKIQNPFTKKWIEHPTHAWKYEPETNAEHIRENRLHWGADGSYEYPRLKSFLSEARSGMVPVDVWKYDETGTTDDGGKEVKDLFGSEVFKNPKPPRLIERCIKLEDDSQPTCVLDFFAGSGTTGHAVINLNREDGGSRKYILVEMGEHFDTVLVPRLKKVIYSKDWKEGKPQNRTTGISHCFKVLRLESYEDTLNNLRLNRSAAHEGALKLMDADQQDEYRLGYMLDVEAEGSASLLNVSAFTDPWDYTLDIASGSAGETRPTKVDLVETYHWLTGLTVTAQRYVEAPKSRKKSAATSGPMLSISEGTNPVGERVLVIWRKQVLMSSKALNEWLTEDGLAARLGEFAEVHVNGDHHLDLLRGKGQTWTARLIDDLFPKLMWEGAE